MWLPQGETAHQAQIASLTSGGTMKRDSPTTNPRPLDPQTDAAPWRVQILSTEHWSLLATRGMTWNEIFSRTGTFLTILSATVIALSLVAQATGFGGSFLVFALLVLPIVLLVGLATFIRLIEADIEDAWLVVGMNRLRHAYLELAPELNPYFVTSHYDDELGVLRTYSFRTHVGVSHLLCGSSPPSSASRWVERSCSTSQSGSWRPLRRP
jgi:hypothetical protein